MMRISVGYWETRDGDRIRVIHTDKPGRYPVVGYTTGGIVITFTSYGYFHVAREKHPRDLIRPWVDKPEVDWDAMPAWANWVGMNSSQRFRWFECEPYMAGPCWCSVGGLVGVVPGTHTPTFAGEWRGSLVMRPGHQEDGQ